MKTLRKVWRYKGELVELAELKTGDLFQIRKRDENDSIDESELYLALGDATPMICSTDDSTHKVVVGNCLAKPMPLELLGPQLGGAEK